MFNIPFNYRDGYSAGDPLPIFGNVKAVLWVDALKGVYNGLPYSGATIGNTDVRLWQDQTVYGNNLTATTSNSPTYSASTFSPSGSSSSFPYVKINDVSQEYMAANLSPSLTGISSGFTVFFVFKRNVDRTWNSAGPIIQFNADWNLGAEGFAIGGNSSPTTIDMSYYNNAFNKTTISIPWGSDGVDSTKFFYYTYRMSGGTCNGYVDSTLKATATAVGVDKTMKAVASNAKFYVSAGFNGDTFAQSAPIDVAEVLVYDGAVSDAGLITVWNYFKQKYGFIN